MEHAATRHEAGVGGTHEAMGRDDSSSKAIFKITIDYDEAKAREPRYVQVLGTASLTGERVQARPMYGTYYCEDSDSGPSGS